jgi:dynein heavy chain
MGVFGKSDTFVERIHKVEKMFACITKWSKLSNSRVDGLEPLVVQFRSLVKTIKQKGYDPLDIRQLSFDSDYDIFFTSIEELRVKLQVFCDKTFEAAPGIMRVIDLLHNFQLIEFIGIDLTKHHQMAISMFAKEVEEVKRFYTADRADPPIPWAMPPLAGRITWARHLFSRIEKPMKALQSLKPELLTASVKTVKSYNKCGRVLLEFEGVCYDAWVEATENAYGGLRSSVLVIHSGELLVNLDSQAMQLVAESRMIKKLGLEMSPSANLLVKKADALVANSERLQVIVDKYVAEKARIPEKLALVMKPAISRMDQTISPGLRDMNWLSTTFERFLSTVWIELTSFADHLDTVLDILDVRIDALLDDITSTVLCAIPESGEGSWTAEEFESNSAGLAAKEANKVELLSEQIERSVSHLATAISTRIDAGTSETDEFKEALTEMNGSFVQALGASITKSVRQSLDMLKRRASTRVGYGSSAHQDSPIISTEVALEDSTVIMRPTLDVIQQSVSKAVDAILAVSGNVLVWGQDRTAGKAGLETHLDMVKTNKEVARLIESTGTIVSAATASVTDQLEVFAKYKSLWEDDREAKMEEFVEKKPDLTDFAEGILAYENMEEEIETLPSQIVVGAITLETEPFKRHMIGETSAWKSAFARRLNVKSQDDMNAVFEFTDDILKRLGRDIHDLEDVRLSMETLKDLRENEIKIDALMAPIEAGYKLLEKYNVKVTAAEHEQLDSMQFQWGKMVTASAEKNSHLVTIQPEYKEQLTVNVAKFQVDQKEFLSDYNIRGPMQGWF